MELAGKVKIDSKSFYFLEMKGLARSIEEYLKVKHGYNAVCSEAAVRLPSETSKSYITKFHVDQETAMSAYKFGRLKGFKFFNLIDESNLELYDNDKMINFWAVLQNDPVENNPLAFVKSGFTKRGIFFTPDEDATAYYKDGMQFGDILFFNSLRLGHGSVDINAVSNGEEQVKRILKENRMSAEVRCLINKV